MISSRCKGLNLLNHCRQTDKLENINISYSFNKESELLNCTIIFEVDNKKCSFSELGIKKQALQNLVYSIYVPLLREK